MRARKAPLNHRGKAGGGLTVPLAAGDFLKADDLDVLGIVAGQRAGIRCEGAGKDRDDGMGPFTDRFMQCDKLEAGAIDSGFFEKFAPGGGLKRLTEADPTAGQAPQAAIRRLAALHEKNALASRETDGDAQQWFFTAIHPVSLPLRGRPVTSNYMTAGVEPCRADLP
ncbi:hypothetical protein OH818_04045 [Jiella pelagia]|uniref:Uncharacterized protein n=1 Tax=Jiella pelagia TaxID=2986949 RepID=A0ABY7C105_9HYPH|nr:hypothetical protein [Jiella pelagia]WAP69446.1 hypothetical protein OH818_04045 [Jiella pelagia]